MIAAAFTGIFGATDVAETVLGKGDAKEVLAIVAVATAGALALAGTAPLPVQTLRRLDDEGAVTPFGLIVAGLVTVAATGGELGVTVAAVRGTDVGDHVWILVAGIIGGVLLAADAVTATIQALRAGEEKHAAPKPPMTLLEVLRHLLDWINHQAAVEEYSNLTAQERSDRGLVEPQAPAPLALPDVLLPEQRRRTAIL